MTVKRFSSSEVQKFASSYNETEILTEQERQLNEELRTAKDNELEASHQITNLGSKPYPGKKPNAESYIVSPVKPVCVTWIVCLTLLFLFHCVIWIVKLIFDISWDTWEWTKTLFWGGLTIQIILIILCSLIFAIRYYIWNKIHKKALEWSENKNYLENLKQQYIKEQKSCQESLNNIYINRCEVLAFSIRRNLNLPIKLVDKNSYPTLRNQYFQLEKMQQNFSGIEDAAIKLKEYVIYANKKLNIFFEYSIPSEAPSQYILNEFMSIYNGNKSNYRKDVNIPYLADSNLRSIVIENSGFCDDLLDADILEFTELLNNDTSGLFTKHSSSKLEEQVNALERVYRNAVATFDSYTNVVKKINRMLNLSRLVAYKNLYLGVELLNIIRENSGGGTLSTAADSITSTVFSSKSTAEIIDFSSSIAFKDILNTGFESVLNTIGNGISDKHHRKYMIQNPKTAALAVAGVAVYEAGEALVKAWKQRNAKIDSLLKKQQHIVEEMEKIPDAYWNNMADSARALEIIEAIIRTNKGFISIYEPIASKIFVDEDINSVTLKDCQQLVLAIKEYKNISSSEL